MTSLIKKLSIALVAGVVAALGFVVPAQAAGSVTMITNPAPTFDSGTSSTTPAFDITVDSGSSFTADGIGIELKIRIDGSGANAAGMWSPKTGCASTFTNFATAGCGITAVTLATGATGSLGTVQVQNDFGTLNLKGLGTASAINIQFGTGAWNTAAGYGTYVLSAKTSFNTTVGTLNLTVNAPPPPSSKTVTFNSNGGSGTMAAQSGSSPSPLNANSFTKSGTTFSGWSSSCSGPVVYTNQAMYMFALTTTLYAVWADGSNNCGGGSSGNTATATMTLGASSGQLVAGSNVAVVASGLQTTAPYTVVVQSTPQTIGSGNAVSGAVNTSVTLPAGLEAGWHTLTFTSTASDGSTVTSVSYFKVSASGTLLATSSTIPAELANTGVSATTGISLLVGGASLALIGAELLLIARRKRSN